MSDKRSIVTTADLELLVPETPRSIRINQARPWERGCLDTSSLNIENVPEEALRELGRLWTEKLIRDAAEIRQTIHKTFDKKAT